MKPTISWYVGILLTLVFLTLGIKQLSPDHSTDQYTLPSTAELPSQSESINEGTEQSVRRQKTHETVYSIDRVNGLSLEQLHTANKALNDRFYDNRTMEKIGDLSPEELRRMVRQSSMILMEIEKRTQRLESQPSNLMRVQH